ncbi:CYtochrome P450 family [Caenorhabditis elegans]|nr:CYtochrome P450 family [Caenorhabditis elegans]CUR30017.1 CYtochrome P450 family [Caenorhabditis elegans]|eukprot:NP_001303718.1 CYtochrome P450 family [Caenorhabditis elegans]
MNNEEVFPDPHTFNPDRFIDEHGKLKRVEELAPFSVGKRSCPGEGLARMELFLFIANFLNRYKIYPSKEGPPSMDKSNGALIAPRLFSATLKRRS